MQKHLLFFLTAVSLFLVSCAHLSENFITENSNPALAPQKIETVLIQPIRFSAKKALYSGRNQSLYVLDDSNNELVIYRNQKLVNRIGRNSTGSATIQRISDICLSQDGNLWLLDNFQKTLYKVDFNGMILTHFTLTEPLNPTHFVLDEHNSLIVYDKGKNELLVYESLSMKYIFSFGRMMFVDPLSISSVRDRVWIYDKGQDKSFTFLSTGKLILEQQGQWFYDNNLNLYQYKNALLQNKTNQFNSTLDLFNRDTIQSTGQFITQTGEHQINVYEIKY